MAAIREGRGKRNFLEENDIFSLGGEAVRAADRSCHGLMSATHAQVDAIFYSHKKAQKTTEYRDTAPLTLYFLASQISTDSRRWL